MADIYGIVNANIDAAANIRASKLEHEHRWSTSQTGTVAAATLYPTINRDEGTLISLEAAITETVATGADRTVTIDLLRSTGGGAYASVLSSTLVLDNGNTVRVLETATISSADMADGDTWKLTVAVAGAAGNQALGLVVALTWKENSSQ